MRELIILDGYGLYRMQKSEGKERVPQRLKSNLLQPLTYGLKPVPFRKPEFLQLV